jgi:hypothetical protein
MAWGRAGGVSAALSRISRQRRICELTIWAEPFAIT